MLCQFLSTLRSGNGAPQDITGILSSVGADADSDKLTKLLSALEGKDLVEVGRAPLKTWGEPSFCLFAVGLTDGYRCGLYQCPLPKGCALPAHRRVPSLSRMRGL